MDESSVTAASRCAKCGGAAAGWKCDLCGAESAERDGEHHCGVEHCVVKCATCNEAETNCVCVSVGAPLSAPAAGAA